MDGDVYLVVDIDTYNHFIIPMHKRTYSFIYYLIAYVISS